MEIHWQTNEPKNKSIVLAFISMPANPKEIQDIIKENTNGICINEKTVSFYITLYFINDKWKIWASQENFPEDLNIIKWSYLNESTKLSNNEQNIDNRFEILDL